MTPDGGVATGDRFMQTGDLGETIGRGEYQWKMFGGDWQMSGEAAFNTLDNVAALAVLDPSGAFADIPFEGGTGGVRENRCAWRLGFGRPLNGNEHFQHLPGPQNSSNS